MKRERKREEKKERRKEAERGEQMLKEKRYKAETSRR